MGKGLTLKTKWMRQTARELFALGVKRSEIVKKIMAEYKVSYSTANRAVWHEEPRN